MDGTGAGEGEQAECSGAGGGPLQFLRQQLRISWAIPDPFGRGNLGGFTLEPGKRPLAADNR